MSLIVQVWSVFKQERLLSVKCASQNVIGVSVLLFHTLLECWNVTFPQRSLSNIFKRQAYGKHMLSSFDKLTVGSKLSHCYEFLYRIDCQETGEVCLFFGTLCLDLLQVFLSFLQQRCRVIGTFIGTGVLHLGAFQLCRQCLALFA